ncbi:hypothetical protein BDQ17DRAFT_1350411 [Cyathus striatus]|nr:hypothetical protein BDQ17DRAFT_1350411 [Cyathus striatus]
MSGLTIALDIKPTFGYIFIGLLASAVFYGVTIMQTISYFRMYENDIMFLRILVSVLWVLDTTSLIMVSHGVYTWVITNYANPLGLNIVVWTILAEPLCTATIACTVHIFMAYRIRTLNIALQPLAIVIAIIAFLPLALAITAVIVGFTTGGSFAVINTKLHWLTIASNVSTATLDITIAAVLCIQLHMYKQQQTFEKTNKMIMLVNIYLITSSLLTSLITTSGLITFFAAPTTLVYEGLNVITSKAYTNMFLAQLNARESIRGRGINTSMHSNAGIGTQSAFRVAALQKSHDSSDIPESDGNQSTDNSLVVAKRNSSDFEA